jgi:two-component system, sensor histidine kinase YesM
MQWLKKSLFAKLLVGMLVAAIVPFVLSNIVTYKANSSSIKRQLIELNQNAMDIGMGGIKSYLNELVSLSASYYNDGDLMKYLQSPAQNTAYESLSITGRLKKIYASHMELKATAYKSALMGQTFFQNNDFLAIQPLVFDIPGRQNGSWDIKKEYQVLTIGNERILLLNKLLIDYPDTKVLGLTSLYIGLSRIGQIANTISDLSKGSVVFILIHKEKQLLYVSEEDKVSVESMNALSAGMNGNKGSISGVWNERKGVFIYSNDRFQELPLTLVKFVPDTTINDAANKTLQSSLTVQTIAVIFVIVLASVVSYFIIYRVKRILRSIAKVQTGNFNVDHETVLSDELGVLEQRFQNMVRALDVLVNQEYRNQIELSTARLKMLQAQINPHFLYNTLQSIGTLALRHGSEEISDKIAELGAIFRYSMDQKTEIVPLEFELKHIEHYLSLQTGRFKNKLTYRMDCPKEALGIMVPKMILQPLVENSIVHGIEKGRGNGSLHISIQLERELHIRVIDNGRGIAPATLDKLGQEFAGRQLKTERESSIGLLNVLHRLQLYFGAEFTWDIQSVPYEVTVVSLRIPNSADKGEEQR